MAVYDGVPSIRLEGDEKRALALIPEAKVLLYTVQSFKERAGVGTFSMSRRIDDDSVIYVLSAQEQNIIHISVASDVPEHINDETVIFESSTAPDFYSGLVYGGRLELRTQRNEDGSTNRYLVCVSFSPTPNCRNTHAELAGGRQAVPRLAVRPWPAFDELNDPARSNSQYTKLRSSMYSGKMKQVVQVVMGLGRINKAKLRDPRASKPDTEYIKDVDAHGVQVRFDWRFIRTHGITVAADGRLWLVEVSSARGVLAMPLPIFPQSDTPEFKERARARGDTAMQFALNELGCLPTGEAFPNTSARLEEAIAQGDVLRLATVRELRDFYVCSAYSSAMGWAFSSNGSEAHNTAYYYGSDGLQRGVWYQVNITIGETITERDRGQPIATGSASLRRNSEGYIYCPPSPARVRFVPFKCYEPMLPGLLSHDGAPSLPVPTEQIPLVDTPMFVSFVNGDLQVARFFRTTSAVPTEITDTLPPDGCTYDGEWEYTSKTGPQGIPAMMYTNGLDTRDVLPSSSYSVRIKSTPRGFTDYTSFSVDRIRSLFYRFRRFNNATVVESSDGYRLAAAIVVPEYSREAYYMATASQRTVGERVETTSELLLRDANFYGGNHFGIDENEDGPGVVAHVEVPGAPVANPTEDYDWITGHYIFPDGCAVENANSGGWLPLLSFQRVITREFPVRPSTSVRTENTTEETAKLILVTPGHGGEIDIPVTAEQVFDHWMAPSPNPDSGAVQFIYAEHSGIGDDAVVYATSLSSYLGDVRVRGYTPDVVASEYPAFIGVNTP